MARRAHRRALSWSGEPELLAPARPRLACKPSSRIANGRSGERAKQSFLAAMTHELRTPLNAIIGFAEIMDAELLGPVGVPQYRQYVRDILASSRRLLQIIEDVLDMSRGEAGDLVLLKREVDLRQLISEAQLAVEEHCRSRRIDVALDVPDDVVVRVDPQKLSRAIACLLSNAVKFSPDGSSVSVSVSVDPHATVSIAVEDHGSGIEPGCVDLAFEPFAQLDDELSRQFDGAGLGLPLARIIAELHGGSLRLESVPGVGTTAILQFPAYATSRTAV